MKFKLNLLLLLTIHQIVANQPKNMEELENAEDWEGIQDQICKHNHSNDIRKQIEKCHMDNDPYYKLDSYSKQCDKLRAPPGSTWYDDEKGECVYNECYTKVSKTKEFERLSKEVEKLTEKEQVEKAYAKYKCIRKALGLKV